MCVSAVRRTAVHLCPCGSADRHVPLQVQADEADPYVQGPQAPHLLQVQHCECFLFVFLCCTLAVSILSLCICSLPSVGEEG